MPRLDLSALVAAKMAGGTVRAMKGAGWSWAAPLPPATLVMDDFVGVADGVRIDGMTRQSGFVWNPDGYPSRVASYSGLLRARPLAGSPNRGFIPRSDPAAADQFCQGAYVAHNTTGSGTRDRGVCLGLRIAAANQGYRTFWNGSALRWEIWRGSADGTEALLASVSASYGLGVEMPLRFEVAGFTLRTIVNGTTVLEVTDTDAGRRIAAGRIGLGVPLSDTTLLFAAMRTFGGGSLA